MNEWDCDCDWDGIIKGINFKFLNKFENKMKIRKMRTDPF